MASMPPTTKSSTVPATHASILVGSCLDRLKDIPDSSVDAIVTDPPYGLAATSSALVTDTLTRWLGGERSHLPTGAGFMGKEWDSFVPPPAVWDECLRVLKPGGHLLAFAGSRTSDLMGISIRLAGFEVRDALTWHYSTGMPKSMDLSKAIDKGTGENRARQLRFTAWMRSTGVTAAQLNEATGTSMGGHYLTDGSQPAIATADHFDKIRPLLGEVPEEIERLVAERTGIEWTAYKQRPVTGQHKDVNGLQRFAAKHGATTAPVAREKRDEPATDLAKRWKGWGTALTPTHEPILVARKPITGTLTGNVVTHGVGGMNIDGCRHGERWPSNTVLTHAADEDGYDACSMGCVEGCAVHEVSTQKDNIAELYPTFRYQAKPSKREKEAGLSSLQAASVGAKGNGLARKCATCKASTLKGCACPERTYENPTMLNSHPTVKPVELMRWLIRLVTPEGGTVVDPFLGSGTTAVAAVWEGMTWQGCEITPEYLPIISARVTHAEAEKVKADAKAVADAERAAAREAKAKRKAATLERNMADLVRSVERATNHEDFDATKVTSPTA